MPLPLDGVTPTDLDFDDAEVLVWVPVQQAARLLWRENPKMHDMGGLIQSIQRYGFVSPPKYDANLAPVDAELAPGAIMDGNGRTEALAMMEREGDFEPPRGVALHKETGAWYMPVRVGLDQPNEPLARAAAIDLNNLTLTGGDLTAVDIARAYDRDYAALLRTQAELEALPVTVSGADVDMLLDDIPVRPEFDGLMDGVSSGEYGKSDKNERWFYVEYYGDPDRWAKLQELLADVLETTHNIDPDAFYEMVTAYNE